jgi:hypothetical protein
MNDFARRRAPVQSVKPPWRQIVQETGIKDTLLLTRAS